LGKTEGESHVKHDARPLTDAERSDALDTLRIVLGARPDASTLPLALRELASVRDMAWLARETGLNRTALFRSLRASGNPKLDSLVALLRAFGMKLSVEPLAPAALVLVDTAVSNHESSTCDRP
jgi:probable addiction module antidote protein